ncbi:MAG TPA: hypothetical protein VFT10_03755, partial [Solirubrobacterales bacterium]|nr:hypothetical protein [Solirubrobacterales bacterium]
MLQVARSKVIVLVAVLATVGIVATAATAAPSDTEGQTTLEQRIVPAAPGAYRFLQLGEGEPYTVRQELGTANPGRAENRTSLV